MWPWHQAGQHIALCPMEKLWPNISAWPEEVPSFCDLFFPHRKVGWGALGAATLVPSGGFLVLRW